MSHSDTHVASNEKAWDRAALAYEAEGERDVALLLSGETSLLEPELRLLGDLSDVGRAVHLQCSHGLDALSLLNLGVDEVVGIDLSRAMLAQAERKARALDANARWVHSDVFSIPNWLDRTADLVYTGKGALPWISDLSKWARVVAQLLKPGGCLFIHEGHPLNWVWDSESASHRLSDDGRGYFDRQARPNTDFPASAVARYTPEGEAVPVAWEWPWTLGEVVTAVASAGLRVEHLEEHAEHFWGQFPGIGAEEFDRLPHTYSLVARCPVVSSA